MRADGHRAKLRRANRADECGGAVEIRQRLIIDGAARDRPADQRFEQFGRALAGFEVNCAARERFQNLIDILFAEHEANLVRAGIQGGARGRGIVHHHPDTPRIVAARAARIGKFAGRGIQILEPAQILGAIVELGLGSRALEVLAHHLIPLLCRDRRKLR